MGKLCELNFPGGANVDFQRANSAPLRRTFVENGHRADCYINYYSNETDRCHVYSLTIHNGTYTLRYHPDFQVVCVINVRVLRVCDIRPTFRKHIFC